MANSPSPTQESTSSTEQRSGSATLRLDQAPLHPGHWLSGVVELPERAHGADIRLFVECVHTAYGLGRVRSFRWHAMEFLDGTRLERQAGEVLIPFAVLLPGDAPATTHDALEKQRVDWSLRVQALAPGAAFKVLFEETFEVAVQPRDAAVPLAPATPPRPMRELTPGEVAQRLPAQVERGGDALVIHLPFPVGATTTALVSTAIFAANALALVVPGLPWSAPLESQVPLAIAVVSGGLAALMLVVLLTTARAIEVRPEAVRICRGILGLGFHTSLATRDVEAVVENPFLTPDAIPKYYGVALRTRGGALHGAASRMRDPAHARALASLLRSALGRT